MEDMDKMTGWQVFKAALLNIVLTGCVAIMVVFGFSHFRGKSLDDMLDLKWSQIRQAQDRQFLIDTVYNKARMTERLCKMRPENAKLDTCIKHNDYKGHTESPIVGE